jgi:hypothetical protein
MEAFTMVIVACISGEPACTSARFHHDSFVSVAACEGRIDDVASDFTKRFGERPELRGREVTYDISCMNREQLWAKLGISEKET